MPLHDDTPPKGDYAAYIEKLTQRSQAGTPGQADAGAAGQQRKPSVAQAIQDAAKKARQEARQKTGQAAPPANTASPYLPPMQAPKPAATRPSTGSPITYGPATPASQDQPLPETKRRNKRSSWPLILAVLFFMPMINVVRDMLDDPRPEGFFFLAVALFVIFSIRHSIKSGNEPDKDKKRSAIKKDDDYPNTGH